MRATWIVARAAVRRRRAQTALIGVIVTLCTAAMVVGLALLAAVSGPFDRTFAQLNGAHATVVFVCGPLDMRRRRAVHGERLGG